MTQLLRGGRAARIKAASVVAGKNGAGLRAGRLSALQDARQLEGVQAWSEGFRHSAVILPRQIK